MGLCKGRLLGCLADMVEYTGRLYKLDKLCLPGELSIDDRIQCPTLHYPTHTGHWIRPSYIDIIVNQE
jgi:hypothetical protein